MFRRSKQPETVSPDATLDDSSRHDERLMFAAQKGDLTAFNALVVRHERSIFNLCWRMLGNVPEAEDASQETFLKAWTSAGTFKGGVVRPWLFKIASNCCYDQLRSRSRRPIDSTDSLEVEREPLWSSQSPALDPEQFTELNELSATLQQMLSQIPEDQRLAVVLCDIQELPMADAAAVMSTSIGTVKSRLSRGRAKLRDLLLASEQGRELLGRAHRFSSGKD